MATTYYYTVNSEIIGEHTAGQSRLDYLPRRSWKRDRDG